MKVKRILLGREKGKEENTVFIHNGILLSNQEE
jgi:hypothetical protein